MEIFTLGSQDAKDGNHDTTSIVFINDEATFIRVFDEYISY